VVKTIRLNIENVAADARTQGFINVQPRHARSKVPELGVGNAMLLNILVPRVHCRKIFLNPAFVFLRSHLRRHGGGTAEAPGEGAGSAMASGRCGMITFLMR
jgi:hypothetical protein